MRLSANALHQVQLISISIIIILVVETSSFYHYSFQVSDLSGERSVCLYRKSELIKPITFDDKIMVGIEINHGSNTTLLLDVYMPYASFKRKTSNILEKLSLSFFLSIYLFF